MTHLVAVKRHDYDGKSFMVGEKYKANPIHASALLIAGVAILADGDTESLVQPHEARELTPAPALKPRRKRQYKRREVSARN